MTKRIELALLRELQQTENCYMYQSRVRIRLRGKGEFPVSKTPTSSEPTSPQPRCYMEHTKLKASRKLSDLATPRSAIPAVC